MKTCHLILVAILALSSSTVFAFDPSPLQETITYGDVCVHVLSVFLFHHFQNIFHFHYDLICRLIQSNPFIFDAVLTKAFQVDKNIIDIIIRKQL